METRPALHSLWQDVNGPTSADGELDFRQGGDIHGRVALQDDQVRIEAPRDAAAAVGISEAACGSGGQRGEDFRKLHSRARHESELERGIEMVGITDVGTEKD